MEMCVRETAYQPALADYMGALDLDTQHTKQLWSAGRPKRLERFTTALLGPPHDVAEVGCRAQRIEIGITGERRHWIETSLDAALEQLECTIPFASHRHGACPVKEPLWIEKPGVEQLSDQHDHVLPLPLERLDQDANRQMQLRMKVSLHERAQHGERLVRPPEKI